MQGKKSSPPTKVCVGRVSTQRRRVVLTLAKATLSDITSQNIILYETSFVIAYNQLRKSLTPRGKKDVYPTVVSVKVVKENSSPLTYSTTTDLSIAFTVSFKCKCCNQNTRLFRPKTSSNRKLIDQEVHLEENPFEFAITDEFSRHLQQPLFTTETFLAAFNAVLRSLRVQPRNNLIEASKWLELKEVSCSKNVTNFQTTFSVPIVGDVTQVTTDGLAFFAKVFMEDLNSFYLLSDTTCDPLSRIVIAAKAELAQTSKTPSQRDVLSNFDVVLSVFYSCSGCSFGTKLLATDAGRQLQSGSQNPMTESSRGLAISNSAGICYCVVGASSSKTPLLSAFNAAFARTVLEFSSPGGTLDFLSSIGNVVDVTPSPAPITVNPSKDPSAIPSQSSVKPSLSPTKKPSQSSVKPSLSPTKKPSQSSDKPSLSPSKEPSQSSDKRSLSPSLNPSQSSNSPSTVLESCLSEVGTTFIIPFVGDPSNITQDDLDLLAEKVLESLQTYYNTSDAVCDSLFRVLLSAEADLLNYDGSPSGDAPRRILAGISTFNVRVKVNFKCSACPKSTKLVRNDAARRLSEHTSTIEESRSRDFRALVEKNESVCVCPPETEEFVEPLSSEFNEVFSNAISVLVGSGEIDFITSVGVAIEVKEFNCTAVPADGRSMISLHACYSGYMTLGRDDHAIISTWINSSLARLLGSSCNQEKFNLTEVSFEDSVDGPGPCEEETYFFRVLYTCRGCTACTTLLSTSALPFRSLHSVAAAEELTDYVPQTFVDGSSRHLVESVDSCYCTKEPSASELLDALQAIANTTDYQIYSVGELVFPCS